MEKESIITELILVFLLVMAQIWVWPQYPLLIAVPLGIVIVSWIARKDNFQALGLKPEPMKKDLLEFMICFFIFFFLAIVAIAAISHPDWHQKWNNLAFWLKFFKRILFYYPWALFQQLCLCGYFGNRLNSLFSNKKETALAAALIFSIVHLPNPVLMAVTFIGGYVSIWFFLQARNLYWLALGQAILGPAILMFLDYTLRIGPRF